jgi:hypothetical protein
LTKQYSLALDKLPTTPLVQVKAFQSFSVTLAGIKKETFELRRTVGVEVDQITAEIRKNKLIILDNCKKLADAAKSRTLVKQELELLHAKVLERRRNLEKTLSKLLPAPKATLELTLQKSEFVCSADGILLTSLGIAARAPRRILNFSPFLTRWAQENTHVLNMK